MPAPLVWNRSRDSLLLRLRADGHSWDRIAAALGISRWAAIMCGRAVGARKPEPEPPSAPAATAWTDPDREPLPAGHPVSWGAITRGGLLHGQPYPFPPPPPASPASAPAACPAAPCREAA